MRDTSKLNHVLVTEVIEKSSTMQISMKNVARAYKLVKIISKDSTVALNSIWIVAANAIHRFRIKSATGLEIIEFVDKHALVAEVELPNGFEEARNFNFKNLTDGHRGVPRLEII